MNNQLQKGCPRHGENSTYLHMCSHTRSTWVHHSPRIHLVCHVRNTTHRHPRHACVVTHVRQTWVGETLHGADHGSQHTIRKLGSSRATLLRRMREGYHGRHRWLLVVLRLLRLLRLLRMVRGDHWLRMLSSWRRRSLTLIRGRRRLISW